MEFMRKSFGSSSISLPGLLNATASTLSNLSYHIMPKSFQPIWNNGCYGALWLKASIVKKAPLGSLVAIGFIEKSGRHRPAMANGRLGALGQPMANSDAINLLGESWLVGKETNETKTLEPLFYLRKIYWLY
jgi:hypothetical protein